MSPTGDPKASAAASNIAASTHATASAPAVLSAVSANGENCAANEMVYAADVSAAKSTLPSPAASPGIRAL
jgi:hypothetical protein